MSPRLKTALWIGGGLTVLAILLVPRIFFSGGTQAQGPAPGPPQAPLVTAFVVASSDLEDMVRSTGTLLPDEEVEIRTEVAGRVTTIRFSEGSYVRAGQLLASLDTRVLQAELSAATSRRDLSRVQVERQQALYDIGGLSRQALDQAVTESRVLASDIERLRAEIERRRIYAPFSGQIGLRGLSQGAVVGAGDRIATLRRLDPIKVEFEVPERYLGLVRTGDQIRFSVPGALVDLSATVYAIEPAVRPETRAFTVRARAANPANRLTPGTFAEVELIFERVPNALMIPTVAVTSGADSSLVYMVRNNRAFRRGVLTGVRTGDRVQVTAGLTPGDTILTSGFDELRPGQPVRIDRESMALEGAPPEAARLGSDQPMPQ